MIIIYNNQEGYTIFIYVPYLVIYLAMLQIFYIISKYWILNCAFPQFLHLITFVIN